MNRVQEKRDKRNTRRRRIRARVHGTAERPRLAVFRSNKYLYAQIINDENGETIASASTKELKDNSAEALGAELAKRAKEKKIEKVVFDRGGYLFTGQIKTLADAARQAGLEF